jgi:serine/threonine-protein kinase
MFANQKLLGGRYQFIQALGSNPAGQTFLAADAHYPGHPKCVVHQLRLPTRNPMTLKFICSLLRKKVEVLEGIGQHKQIPSTFAAFDDGQSFYIVQEFIPGRSLEDELVVGSPWSADAVFYFLREVLPVLAFAHENGVLHGHLKPTKIIRHQQGNHLVILDFGGIRTVSQNISGRQQAPEVELYSNESMVYLAPEQLQGKTYFVSDYYALGMIALQALLGVSTTSLPKADAPDLHRAILALLENLSDRDTRLANLLARMIHPDPAQRYQKAMDILTDLERLGSPEQSTLAIATFPLLNTELVDSIELPTLPRKSFPWVTIGGGGLMLLAGLTSVLGLRVPQRLLAAQHVQTATTAIADGQPEAAIAQYSRAIQLLPNHDLALAQRSQLHADLGDPEAALTDITQALEINPENAQYAYDRANLRLSIGDIQGAIEDYTTAIQLDPTLTKALINRGSARAEWGDDDGAIEDYTRALSHNPDVELQAAAYLNRCLSYSNEGNQTLALEDCTTAINLRPSHGLAYQNRGLVRRRLQDFQGSLQDYNIAIQIAPDSADAYYNRGLTRQVMNDLPGAKGDFTQAIAFNPDYVFAYYDRGLLEMESGNRTQAIGDFQKAAQLCLDLGRTGCYEDAQYQINRLTATTPVTLESDLSSGQE